MCKKLKESGNKLNNEIKQQSNHYLWFSILRSLSWLTEKDSPILKFHCVRLHESIQKENFNFAGAFNIFCWNRHFEYSKLGTFWNLEDWDQSIGKLFRTILTQSFSTLNWIPVLVGEIWADRDEDVRMTDKLFDWCLVQFRNESFPKIW